MGNIEGQLFASELEKFRPHQNRLLQASHKQSALMKELTAAYGELLQDKRVRAEQSKYEKLSRNRNAVVSAFKKVYRAFLDVSAGLEKAKSFYTEMKETVVSLDKNVDTFVANRRQEGAALLAKIEKERGQGASSAAEREQQRLKELMERMSVGGTSPQKPAKRIPPPLANLAQSSMASPPTTPRYATQPQYASFASLGSPTPPPPPGTATYYTGSAPFSPAPSQFAPPPSQQQQFQVQNGQYGQRRDSFSQSGYQPGSQYNPQNQPQYSQQGQYQSHQPYNPGAFVPPPPPGPPPVNRQTSFGQPQGYPPQQQQQQGYPQQQQQPPPPPPPPSGYGQQQNQDPWAGLQGWS